MKHPTNPEAGPSDTVPAMLTPGEAVIPASVAQDPDAKPVIRAMVEEGRKRNRQAEANGIPVNHPAAIGAADGYYGYQGGVMNVPKPLGAPPKYNVAKPDYSQYNKAELGTGDQMMLTNDKHRQSVANKEGDHAQKMQHEREKMHQQMKLAQMKADQDYANTMRKEGGKLKAKSDEAELDKHLSEYKQAALTASMEGLGLDVPAPTEAPPVGMADGGYTYDDLVRDNKAFGFHADLAQRGNQQSADYARLMEERQELGIHQGAGVPLGIQGGLSEAQQAERIAAMRAKSGMGFAGGTSQVAQQAAMINNLLASGMSMEDIKQYLGDEIGAIGAPPPQAAPAYDPAAVAPPPVPQQSPVQATLGASGVYGSGPSAAAQDLLGQIQGKADGDTDIVVDGRFYSSHVPEIQGFGWGDWLVQQTNPELAAQQRRAEEFAGQEALSGSAYAGDPEGLAYSRGPIPELAEDAAAAVPPTFSHEGGGPPPEPLASVEAPPSPFPGFATPGEFIRDQEAARAQAAASHPEEAQALLAAQDALREGPQGAELPGDIQAAQQLGEQVMKDLDPMYEVKKQKAAAEAMTQKLEAEQKTNEQALAALGASDSQVVQGETGTPQNPANAEAMRKEAADPMSNADGESLSAADKAPPEEKKGWLASVGNAFKTAFGELADPNSLATAAIVYGANRILGYDDQVAGEQALSFYKKGIQEKQAGEAAAAARQAEREDFVFEKGVQADIADQASARDFKESVALEGIKQRIKSSDPNVRRKALRESRDKARTYGEKTAKEALDTYGTTAVKDKYGNTTKQRNITLTSSQAGGQYEKFLSDISRNPDGSDSDFDFNAPGNTRALDNALRGAVAYKQRTGKDVTDITPFLWQAYLPESSETGNIFRTKNDGMVSADNVNKLTNEIKKTWSPDDLAKGNPGQLLTNDIVILSRAYNRLPEAERSKYEQRATDSLSGFYIFAKNQMALLK